MAKLSEFPFEEDPNLGVYVCQHADVDTRVLWAVFVEISTQLLAGVDREAT
jgi:hypothetical protein